MRARPIAHWIALPLFFMRSLLAGNFRLVWTAPTRV
jgi:hypothetical protein